MVDSIGIKISLPSIRTAQEQLVHGFPYKVAQEQDEHGEVFRETLVEETVHSFLTGAMYKVKPIAHALADTRYIAEYEVSANPPACLIGRNHLLVNGVYYAADGMLALFQNFAAARGCTKEGIDSLTLSNTALTYVTNTFLFEFESHDAASTAQDELFRHAQGLFNRTPRTEAGTSEQEGKNPCFRVGSDSCYTMYIKQRHMKVAAYIKTPGNDKAFAVFDDASADIRPELEALARRILRIEITVCESWLKDHELHSPEKWKNNPKAYETIFELLPQLLRMDEKLRCRAPKELTIAKLPLDCQTVLRDHLDGMNIRAHPLVTKIGPRGTSSPKEQSKRFSVFKRTILEFTGIDITIPWEIQSTHLSPHLRAWLKYPGEYEPDDSMAKFVYSRESVPLVNKAIREKTQEILDKRVGTRRSE